MIRTKLMRHQRDIIRFIFSRPYFGIFAEYGTGKTLCALSYVDLHKLRKVLVVSTKTSIQSTWPGEIEKHTDFRYVTLLGNRRKKLNRLYLGLKKSMVSPGFYHSGKVISTIFLVNFDGVKNIFNELIQSNFDCIIVDESTKIKSPKTKRTKALWALGKAISKRGVMTGFPITEDLSDVYSQIKFLDGGEIFGKSYYAFMDKYFTKVAFRYYPKRNSSKLILNGIKDFCIRVSSDVIDLPPKNYREIFLEATSEQSRLLGEFRKYFQLEFGKVKIDTKYIFSLINKSLQMCDGFIQADVYEEDREGNVIKDENGNPVVVGKVREVMSTNKDEVLVDLLEEINPYRNKVVIWCAYRFSLSKLKAIISRLGYRVLTLTGDTVDAGLVVKKFQLGDKYNILLAIQKKASESLNLTSCNYAIYYSNLWSYDLRANSEARIRRKGSERHKHVFYTDLITKGTIEEKVIDCLRKKKDLIDTLKLEFREG